MFHLPGVTVPSRPGSAFLLAAHRCGAGLDMCVSGDLGDSEVRAVFLAGHVLEPSVPFSMASGGRSPSIQEESTFERNPSGLLRYQDYAPWHALRVPRISLLERVRQDPMLTPRCCMSYRLTPGLR
jgi:hypothetical protein